MAALKKQRDLIHEEWAQKLKESADQRGVPFTAPLLGHPIDLVEDPNAVKAGGH